ncbi:MAG: aminotransferase class V-fold PLP-dependent enzyme [Candidatus Coatesbacteria bacterium]|nr:aminotransferase class V-fold PLP-dependent enzyme [Candidatus Coatesbacteria bacterium]
MAYDVNEIRKLFPAICQTDGGKHPIYLDSACTTAICQPAIDAQLRYYTQFPGCVGRADHAFGNKATECWNGARETIARFLNAASPNEIVVTKNTTESINLLAMAFPFCEGDHVIISDFEHNSNTLPWMCLRERGKISLSFVKTKPDSSFDLKAFRTMVESKRPRLVSVLHKSNLTGVSFPIKEIIDIAHTNGALVLFDAAQSPLTSKLDVRALDCDFLAFSSHKALGPSGVGILYGKFALLEKLGHCLVGGGTALWISKSKGIIFTELPWRLEAGLQNCPGLMGLAAALGTIQDIGQDEIAKHVITLNEALTEGLAKIPSVSILGPENAASRGVILSFRVDGMEARPLAKRLNDEYGLMIRAGKNCVHYWFSTRGGDDVLRVSFGPYSTIEECEALVSAMEAIAS